MGATSLPFGPSTSVLLPTPPCGSQLRSLAWKQAPASEGAALSKVSLTIGQGRVSVRQWVKSQTNGRNLHFEHVCFCVVEPEIPYLLTESDFFFFFVFVAILCGARREWIFWHGVLFYKRYFWRQDNRVEEAQPASKIIALQWPLSWSSALIKSLQ